ncbi:uncharacterized protein [Nicotiana tomentosiformis]|uniref:uncharacterized protein n=1 Tax=Nicotiana tomentosiformis TaxID=4098 RepID=UPI00388C45BA
MFSSEAWNTSTWTKKHEGVKTRATVLFDQTFWPHIAYCVRSFTPLVSVLREVDSEEQPCMGYMYHLMTKAKENIALNYGNNERKYCLIWKRIDERWSSQLHHPLHAAGYYLNPQLRFEDRFSNKFEIKQGLYDCMEHMLNYNERLRVDIQLDSYDHLRGDFGSQLAMDSRKMRSPAD